MVICPSSKSLKKNKTPGVGRVNTVFNSNEKGNAKLSCRSWALDSPEII